MLSKMAKEGLLSELPQRGDKNSVQYSKLLFHTNAQFINHEGEVISLKDFIALMMAGEGFPEIIDKQAALVIRYWMLDILGSVYPEPYQGKRDIPDPEQLKKKLESTLEMTKKFHMLIKNFLESGVLTPVARDGLVQEFKTNAAMEHAAIVDKSWMENGSA
jgi:hypothetical protein